MMLKILLYTAIILIAYFGYKNYTQTNTPKINVLAPSFNLPNAKGELISLQSLKGHWVVLYFYPKDDTPGCTKEACHFRDDLQQLTALGATVVGVSIDDSASHATFAKKYNLPFPLLSDADGAVAKQYGALTNLGLIKMAKRYTFLIDPNGVLRKSYLKVEASRHSQQIIDDLSLLKGL
jgi:thioredoxin-dependent peroxiredoxin